MGTLVTGIKEIFSTAKTTGSNVMLCGNDGTPDGHITMANLASRLGGLAYVRDLLPSDDLNNITGTGCYVANSTQQPANIPSFLNDTSTALIYVIREGSIIIQFCYGVVGCSAYRIYHKNGRWYGWYRQDNFGCNTVADLASSLNGLSIQHVLKSRTYDVLKLWRTNGTPNLLFATGSEDNILGSIGVEESTGNLIFVDKNDTKHAIVSLT